MLSHFDTYAGIRLNIVDVISMINKFLSNGKLSLTWNDEKNLPVYIFPVKKINQNFPH